MIRLLRDGAAADASRACIVGPDGALTYGEALERANAIGRGFARRGIERFGVALRRPIDVIPLLGGASAAGAEACVYPLSLDDDDITRYAERFDHPVVVTDRGALEVDTTTVDELLAEGSDAPPVDQPDSRPVLILTTGTTGEPKGTRHDWTRLLAGVRRPDPQAGNRWLLAYNLNQYAAIQVLTHVMTSKGTIVAPAATQPREVLAVMREYRVTHASATATMWRFLTNLIDDQVASELPLVQISLGGEAVPGPLLERLTALFPDAHISQIYASSEFGSSVSVRDGQNGLPLSVLERSDDADVQFKIVDGQLHARSRIGMLGYHGQDEPIGEWRPTGDLVEIRDERIHFVGRSSDVINVGGVKVHPLWVEEKVLAVDGVDMARAYGRRNAVTGQIVVVDVVAGDGVDTDELEDAIRDACDDLEPAARPRLIKFVESIEVRDSKVVRRET